MNKLVKMLVERLDTAKTDSDFSFFFSLLVSGEAITKLITLYLLSSLENDKDRHKYQIEYTLVRTSGVGDWSRAIDDLLLGTASQFQINESRPFQSDFTKKVNAEEWQHKAVSDLIKSMQVFDIDVNEIKGKVDLRTWFKLFTELRNKTRGHGATLPAKSSDACTFLERSLLTIIDNLSLLSLPTAYLKKNLSGKYRVTPITQNTDEFRDLSTSESFNLQNGIYTYLSGFRQIPLIESDAELSDFFIANGGFNNNKFELLSYISDNKKYGDSSNYLAPRGQLPASESEGIGELVVKGNVFTNVPDLTYEYIARPNLEMQLAQLLKDDRRAVVTLLGRGGIGKTSLALKVIPELYDTDRFDAVIWFSSRDIDLHSSGAKLVRAGVVTDQDMAKYYCKLVLSEPEKNPLDYFQKQLTSSEVGPCLFVFDNFETTDNPLELYKLIDTYVRLPNKVLITTRLRDFIGDYPLTVHGMTEDESRALIDLTSASLGIKDRLSEKVISEIISVSSGHPYIIKVMLGGFANNGAKGSLPKIIAGSDEVLVALFERTYAALTPCAQQVFLTLASWNSAVPRIALETVLMVSIDEPLEVEKSIDNLIQFSMIEEKKSPDDGQYFLGLPYVALAFGAKKLHVSPLKSKISSDSKLLQTFGPCKLEDKNINFRHHFISFLRNIDLTKFNQNKQIIDRICFSFNDGFFLVANFLFESDVKNLVPAAKEYCLLYLENETIDSKKLMGWTLLAEIAKALKEPLDEVHAILEIAQLSDIDFFQLSIIVNTINHKFSTKQITTNASVKRELLSGLYDVIWTRRHEGDAVDLSRIAWLALHLDKIDDARNLVTEGLRKDSDNSYCKKLKEKLDKLH
ncbi:NB-ARC domain-containing protein [Pseudoalteromonas sp. SSDWG2]|uniref:NB-ARC domain-containing protein n=1 Tax=Pseudoalteromonas sp. SSDWG2 TaxID=3139391 RepID=UPI003BABEBE0